MVQTRGAVTKELKTETFHRIRSKSPALKLKISKAAASSNRSNSKSELLVKNAAILYDSAAPTPNKWQYKYASATFAVLCFLGVSILAQVQYSKASQLQEINSDIQKQITELKNDLLKSREKTQYFQSEKLQRESEQVLGLRKELKGHLDSNKKLDELLLLKGQLVKQYQQDLQQQQASKQHTASQV
jgi:hypothetical protein